MPSRSALSTEHRKMLELWAKHVGDQDEGSPGPALHALLAAYDAMQVNRVIKTPIGVEVESSDEKGCGAEPAKGADAEPVAWLNVQRGLATADPTTAQRYPDDDFIPLYTRPAARASPIKAEVTTTIDATGDDTNVVLASPVTTGDADLLLEIDDWLSHPNCAGASSGMLRRCRAMIESLARERDQMGNAIATAAYDAGITTGEMPLTGPQLLLLCDNLGYAAAANASLRAKLDEATRGIDGIIERLLDSAHADSCKARKAVDPYKCDCGYAQRLDAATLASKLRQSLSSQSAQAASQPSNPET